MIKKTRMADAIITEKLPNGLTIHVWPKTGSENMTINAAVATGSMHEEKFLGCGVSHFLEHVAFSGTKKFPGATQIADIVAKTGGMLNASTSSSRTQFYMGMNAKELRSAMEMIYGMIAEPLFPEDRFIKEKAVILRECAMCNDRPDGRLWYSLLENMFKKSTLRYPVIGYESKVAEVTREMVNEYYLKRYSPVRTHFVVAGNVDPEETIKLFSEICSGWKMGRIDEVILPIEEPQTSERIVETAFNDPLARLAMGWKIPAATDRDFPAIDVLMTLLGGLDSSPLCDKLRNELAIVNEIDAGAFSAGANPGAASISASMTCENVDTVTEKTLEIVDSFSEKLLSSSQLAKALAFTESNYIRAIRGNTGAVMTATSAIMTTGSTAELDDYIEKVRALTPQDIRNAAQKYFTRDTLTVVKQLPLNAAKKRTSAVQSAKTSIAAEKVTLSSGARCVIVRGDSSLPLCEINILFPGGRLCENESNLFVSNLVSELLCDGNAEMSEKRFNELLDRNAIILDSGVRNEIINFKMNFTSDKLGVAVKLLCAMFGHIKLDKKIFEREKRNYADDIACDMANPRSLALDVFDSAIFTEKHILGVSSEKVLEVMRNLTTGDAESFISNVMFNPRETVFAVSGDITEKEAFEAAEKISLAIPWNNKAATPEVEEPKFKKGVRKIKKALEKEQAVIICGFPAYKFGTPENDLVKLFSTAANSMSSNLFKTVREERGLAYYTYLSNAVSVNSGTLAYVAGAAPGKENEVMELFEAEMKRMASCGFTADELENAKNTFLYHLDETNQDPSALAFSSAYAEFTGSGYERVFTIRKRIESITLEEMNNLAKTLFNPKTLVKVIVAPEKA